MRLHFRPSLLAVLALGGGLAQASIPLNLDDTASIKAAAQTIAKGMVKYYTGYRPGDVPGNLPSPYYWWEAGAMMGSLIDYWYYTGDTQFNDIVTQAMLHQVGPNKDFMPPNQTSTEGNDDQSFWGFAAMSAAELKYPDPPSDQPQWLALAQAVFNSQALRWDNATCGGGLRWQISSFNNGYNYKNTISNGCFFNLAARLAKYTGNQTYALWADTMWDWISGTQLISSDYRFFDGSDVLKNCSDANHIQWTYNAGVFLLGAATMYNFTNGDPKWRARTEGILNATDVFFYPPAKTIMYEVACEGNGKCDVDQRSFKAYLARWMAATTKMAPFTYDAVMPRIRSSAAAAAKQCAGNANGDTNACGIKWWTDGGVWDGSFGVGEQMSALEVVQSNLITKVSGPVTNNTGGTSQGNPSAGTGGDPAPNADLLTPVTTGDRIGAGFLTTIVLVAVLGGAWWMIV